MKVANESSLNTTESHSVKNSRQQIDGKQQSTSKNVGINIIFTITNHFTQLFLN